ncbi:hypothetical protein MRB53_003296 [Persea americana]|uniref:Uncharacterized protein n=1 Tax=Persea americana TaxID=3435 RepID=A0ACC2MX89_PERAE|nr:hypothetical protein MRB53_003296 [Persea americana]
MTMVSSACVTFSLPSLTTLIDAKAPRQQSHCLTLPIHPNHDSLKTISVCRRIARNVITMATGETQYVATSEAPATTSEVATSEALVAISEEPAEAATEVPDIVKSVQTAWDKVDDKYGVTSLAVAGVVALWGSTGLISAIDRLPLIPGVLELVGIGYTGWFVYQNLVFNSEREALLKKVKDTYNDIIGSN